MEESNVDAFASSIRDGIRTRIGALQIAQSNEDSKAPTTRCCYTSVGNNSKNLNGSQHSSHGQLDADVPASDDDVDVLVADDPACDDPSSDDAADVLVPDVSSSVSSQWTSVCHTQLLSAQ